MVNEINFREPKGAGAHGEGARGIRGAFKEGVADKLFWLKLTLALGLALGFALSHRLWLASSRLYPTAPVFDFLPPVPYPLDYLWLAALLLLIAAAVILKRPRAAVLASVCVAALLVLWDQSRLQPWFYHYIFILAALGLMNAWRADNGASREAALNTCRLVVAGIYLWSGLQKMNYSFAAEVVPSLTSFVVARAPEALRPFGAVLGVLIPLVEFSVGLGLLTRKFRDAAVALAFAMHLFILALFIPPVRNTVVWPWNVAMPVLVFILFWRGRSFSARDIVWNGGRAFHALALALFLLMPAPGLFGLWDSYLSAALYAGNTRRATLRLGGPVRDALPPRVQRVVRVTSEGALLSVTRWSYAELNVPPYPEPRIFRRVARRLCEYAADPEDVVLTVRGRPRILDGARDEKTYNCRDL